MRARTLRMVPLSSLAAFSQSASAALQVRDSRPVGGTQGIGGVERQLIATPPKPAHPVLPAQPPSGPLPRGSLLNLTI
ncbi:hypothetical protein FK498_01175 [Elioraea sp. Yellowstone]|jgi:hypothetical protein|nr:hypothetical protein FK498_01175 [Elioraea sp. Yellowstone]